VAAWGQGPFENDEAMDLLVQLVKAFELEREQRIRSALLLPSGHVPGSEAREAVAAAALIAAANGMPALEPPETAHLMRGGGIPVDEETRRRARTALTRVSAASEWRDGWEEAELLTEVQRVVDGIGFYL
jgi:hypothetical protein